MAVGAGVSWAFQRVAIHASNRQATCFGVHGLPAARQFKLLAFQTSSQWVLTTQSRGPPYEHCIQTFIRRVGPLFWLLEPKMQNRVGWIFFSGSFCSDSFCFVSGIKAVCTLSLSPSFYPPPDSICWFAIAVKSYFRQFRQSWAVSTRVSWAS